MMKKRPNRVIISDIINNLYYHGEATYDDQKMYSRSFMIRPNIAQCVLYKLVDCGFDTNEIWHLQDQLIFVPNLPITLSDDDEDEEDEEEKPKKKSVHEPVLTLEDDYR
jgi:hypothetical protein